MKKSKEISSTLLHNNLTEKDLGFCQTSVMKLFAFMFKVNNKDTRTTQGLHKTFRGTTWRRSGVFIVNFEHISHLVLLFLLLTLNM